MKPVVANLKLCVMVPDGITNAEQLKRVVDLINKDQYMMKLMAYHGLNFQVSLPAPDGEETISPRDYMKQVRGRLLDFMGRAKHTAMSASYALDKVVSNGTIERIISLDPKVMHSTLEKVDAVMLKKGLVLA